MKKCKGNKSGIILIIFGLGILFALALPMRFLAFLLTLIIIYIGIIILKSG